MPFVYEVSLATAGVVTTNGSGNTENNTASFKASSTLGVGIQSFYSLGRANAATTISGIVHRMIRWGTASSAGTALGLVSKHSSNPASAGTATYVSAATNGTTRLNGLALGHGAAGPGGWVAPNVDSVKILPGGNAASYDFLNAAAAASLTFEWSAEIVEQ